MDEPQTATMAPAEAADALRTLSRWDLALRQRMEGVLWIVMGLTLTSLFFSYAFAVIEDVPVGVLSVLWVPWTLGGLAVVWSLRRSLALAGPVEEGRSWAWSFAGIAAIALLALFALLFGGREVAPTFGLLGVGALALAPALLPRMGYTPLGRRVGLALGGIGILAALGILFAGGDGTWGTWAAAGVAMLWVGGGVYQVVQG